MKSRVEILAAIILGVILPILLMGNFQRKEIAVEESLSVDVIIEGEVVQLDMETYLTGVLLGEMPGGFHSEALKAQAVAARTFTLYNVTKGKHKDGTVCTSSTCCQAYISPEDYISHGGNNATVEKMFDAVMETKGEVLIYNGNLIEATFFSSSGGITEDAQAVWGTYVPYLQSVQSGEGDMPFKVEMTKEKFCTSLGLPNGEVYISTPVYTKGDGIAEIIINGKKFTGMELRKALGLRSTRISFYVGKDTIQIVTNGYGHRVGLSQYGADAMANEGYDYKQILMHYYSGVSIQAYNRDKN